MRTKILTLLREQSPAPVSGEEISARLGISRTAVWKHIHSLMEAGYVIETVAKKGYSLLRLPDKLYPAEIAAVLRTNWLGRQVYYSSALDSTNEEAKKLAEQGCPHGALVVAEEQTRGKGRLARGWFSPAGKGCWCSVVLRPPFLPQEAAKCTLLAAVAVVKAVNKYQGVQAAIKWPNDVLLQGKKMVGILTEMSAEFGKINYLVIGTGINVSVTPEDLPEELRLLATSLTAVAREQVVRVQVLADYLYNLEALYELVLKQGFKPVLEEWRRYSNTLGRQVKVLAPDEEYVGLAEDIDEEGLLLVRRPDGRLSKVLAGDVSIRPASGR